MASTNPEERDSFSNPLAPDVESEVEEEDDGQGQPLTNDDFRKLMMTPRRPRSSSQSAGAKVHKETHKSGGGAGGGGDAPEEETGEEDAASRRRKKKMFYAKQHKLEEEREKELAKMYRDRAQERRDGLTREEGAEEKVVTDSTTADYRAVAPDASAGENLAERRKQVILESKYLGGDMEHTHLVKGLDYALLEKVRAEICSKEQDEDMMEAVVTRKIRENVEEPAPQMSFHTKLARNIVHVLFLQRPPQHNELFLPGRMAYAVDLEDDTDDTDIPTTLIRSKADCPAREVTATLTTNDIVISKLTQILSYLRQGRKDSKKMKKKDKGKLKDLEDRTKLVEDGIYGDIGSYVPSHGKSKSRDRHETSKRDRGRDHPDRKSRMKDDRSRTASDKKRSYFEKPADEDEVRDVNKLPTTAKQMINSINESFASQVWGTDTAAEVESQKKMTHEEEQLDKLKKKMTIDSYAECYPGMMESADAIDDSEDEVDYLKMDQGNKKGPVGRWDFDTQEEYSNYMSSKEALPKAAFQYGVKMADGRKTRRTGPKDEKAVLDREWQKIQNLMTKRKQMAGDGGPYSKNPKY